VISDAVRRGASDIHIEPGRTSIKVRYRIDGRMQPIMTVPATQLGSLVARIKILGSLDISETRKPQDGGCMVPVDGRAVELRVSTLPGNHGEIVVMRILGQNAGLQRLEGLGMEPEMLRDFRQLLISRQGILLITGPTGSGKSTTLYAALNHLNTDDVNIITVEDPVEIDVEGINQVQIHERAGRTFAGTLRSMLRQDPDIIMIGEIRDSETAEIACRAALTGHLVLSTLHTQDTVGTLVRLNDMGVAPYLVASSLNGALAQRLAQRVCEDCAEPYTPPPALADALERYFGSLESAQFRKGTGCPRCLRTGTRGRIGVYELLKVDEDLRHLMVDNHTPSAVRKLVTSRGFQTMEDDAFRKCCRGLLTPEELIRLGFGFAMKLESEAVSRQ
jgi:type IV pilus assembly protein PilB